MGDRSGLPVRTATLHLGHHDGALHTGVGRNLPDGGLQGPAQDVHADLLVVTLDGEALEGRLRPE